MSKFSSSSNPGIGVNWSAQIWEKKSQTSPFLTVETSGDHLGWNADFWPRFSECVKARVWVCVCVMLRVSFPSQMGGCTVFHCGCAVFWGGCTVFQGGCTAFCCGTALTYKSCILLLLDYFHPRNDGFVSCLPFTEHVQTLFTLNWACANSVLGMCRNNLHNLPCFWQFWLITMTQT